MSLRSTKRGSISHRRRRWLPCAALALALIVAVCAPAASAAPYVDGISDQSLPSWDTGFPASPFARYFARDWVAQGHIRLARYVAQWNVTAPAHAGSWTILENWLRDVHSLGLIPDVGLTSYDDVYPSSPAAYRASLQALLARAAALGVPIRYIEAWNEPNNQGHRPPAAAAALTNAASAVCAAGNGCAVIAGDLEDSPDAGAFERAYARLLDPLPAIWGVHPYRSVEAMSEAPYANVVANLPRGGAGEQVWITEVAAHRCHDYGGQLVDNGALGQAQRARWLIDTLIPVRRPAHVFYYGFLLKERKTPDCRTEREDDALYVPSADPDAPDAPRPAASIVLAGAGVPAAYTGAATDPPAAAGPAGATLTGSVYPGGRLPAAYHFQYGTSTAYGNDTPAAAAGAGTGAAPASATLDGLSAETAYHYRLVAWNAEGALTPSYGADRTFTTPGLPALWAAFLAGGW